MVWGGGALSNINTQLGGVHIYIWADPAFDFSFIPIKLIQNFTSISVANILIKVKFLFLSISSTVWYMTFFYSSTTIYDVINEGLQRIVVSLIINIFLGNVMRWDEYDLQE